MPDYFSDTKYHMVNISDKKITKRRAIAQGEITVGKQAFELIRNKQLPKGDVLAIAEISGISGAKKTADLIPFCHPLNLEHVSIKIALNENAHSITVYCLASTHAKTGIEMEALAGVNTALLTIYDLTKMVEPALSISNIRLLLKEGGKKGLWIHPEGLPDCLQTEVIVQSPSVILSGVTTAIITLSSRAHSGNYPDESGALLEQHLKALGCNIINVTLLPDNKTQLIEHLQTISTQLKPQLIITTGGTGLAPDDQTPEAILACATKEIPGIAEMLRHHGARFYTEYAWLSRSVAALVKQSLVIALPGSPKAVAESITILETVLPHALKIVTGGKHD